MKNASHFCRLNFFFPVPQLEGQVVALLVQNMERLDEQVKEEADGIHNTLGKNTLILYCYFLKTIRVIFYSIQ